MTEVYNKVTAQHTAPPAAAAAAAACEHVVAAF